tara:strand:+ start:336 stop:1544 length:1209 start_codon:yes stop_codon:yes gene_type:complete
MAFRFFVTYVNARASVSYSKVQTLVSVQKASATTTSVGAKTDVHSQLLKSLVNYLNLTTVVHHVQLSATDILLDADSKNLYFTLQHNSPNRLVVTLTDIPSFTFSKTLTDTPVITDFPSVGAGKTLTDSLTFGESVITLLEFIRDFSDSASMGDATVLFPTLGKSEFLGVTDSPALVISSAKTDSVGFLDSHITLVGLGPTDTPTLTEVLSYSSSLAYSDSTTLSESLASSLAKPAADIFNLADAPTISAGVNPTDTASLSEVLARVVSFQRSFSDAFTLDDEASVDDPLATGSGLNKDNLANLSDLHIYTFAKVLADTYTVSEQISLGPSKNTTDSFSVSETLFNTSGIGKTEAVSISDALLFSLGNSYTDSATISESAQIKLIVSRSVLNTAALNTSALN